MARVGVLTVSDGRDTVHRGIADFVASKEDELVSALEASGQVK